MSMLLQQIRRSTYSRKRTAAALTPSPNTFSRALFTTNSAFGPEKGTTFAEAIGKIVLKYGLGLSFIYGTFHWVDYGGYRKTKSEMKRVEEETKKERKAFKNAKKQLDELRERERKREMEREMERLRWRIKEMESEARGSIGMSRST